MSFPSSTLFPSATTWPGTEDEGTDPGGGESIVAGKLRWDKPSDRIIQAGLDRGVLYLRNGLSAAWNGLTAVEESGGESAAEYYIDGRPFLYLPTPKEFSATLKAYTYPDEFNSVMGQVEAADGMLLDSQMGDEFALSYRTQISGVNGPAGYKLHLIYNATVVPSSIAYSTVAESVNPIEFSWAIQAVPVPIPGFRATAHITIDTRHMDPDKLRLIEALLYGTGNSNPMMPNPSVLLDMLSFGEAIIITDNGDGTWSAQGSYTSVYMVDDSTFEITGVDAVDHGDGTYTVSSTNV